MSNHHPTNTVVAHIVLRVSNPASQPFHMHSSLNREASRRLQSGSSADPISHLRHGRQYYLRYFAIVGSPRLQKLLQATKPTPRQYQLKGPKPLFSCHGFDDSSQTWHDQGLSIDITNPDSSLTASLYQYWASILPS
jgi:hypothetical protein